MWCAGHFRLASGREATAQSRPSGLRFSPKTICLIQPAMPRLTPLAAYIAPPTPANPRSSFAVLPAPALAPDAKRRSQRRSRARWSEGSAAPGRADVRPRGFSAVRHGCGEACSPRWAWAEAKAGDLVDCHEAMPPGPPKSGSAAASDGKAALSRSLVAQGRGLRLRRHFTGSTGSSVAHSPRRNFLASFCASG